MKNQKKIFSILLLTIMLFSLKSQASLFDFEENEDAPNYIEEESNFKDLSLRQRQDTIEKSGSLGMVKNFYYSPNSKKSFYIKTRRFIDTIVNFPEDDEIAFAVIGDEQSFNLQYFDEIMPNSLLISTFVTGVDTSLLVKMKSGISYKFIVASYAIESNVMPFLEVNVNLEEEKARMNEVQLEEIIYDKARKDKDYLRRLKIIKDIRNGENFYGYVDYLKSLKSPDQINANYKMKGNELIAPEGVFDDGQWTYFDFRKNFVANRFPALYKVVDGYDVLVNFRVENGFLIAETLSEEGFTLKNGDDYVCIKPTESLVKRYKKTLPKVRLKSEIDKNDE
jgi:type IV secretory pathway VirB9-like protein